MKITILYKLLNQTQIHEVPLTPEEYFDPLLENENYEDDGIPKYNDTWEYFPEIPYSNFEWDEHIISDSQKNDKRIRTDYFAGGESRVTHRKDANGYELIIQSVLIRANEVYISRMERYSPDENWRTTDLSLGQNFEGGANEKWYNLKNELCED